MTVRGRTFKVQVYKQGPLEWVATVTNLKTEMPKVAREYGEYNVARFGRGYAWSRERAIRKARRTLERTLRWYDERYRPTLSHEEIEL